MINIKIFVGIVATEDANLVNTIQECLDNAMHPENITFGIAMQYESLPDLSFINDKSRTIILDKDDDSLGIIGARSSVRKLHRNEDYYLQINSSAEFIKNWDDLLIHDLELFKDKKTIISSKLLPLDNKNEFTVFDLNILDENNILSGVQSEDENFIKQNSNGKNYFNSTYISNDFIFARSRWIYEMKFPQYHKDSYEDVELSVVSFCNGYTVVAPKKSRRIIFGNPSRRTMTVLDAPIMNKEIKNLLMIGRNKHFDLTQNTKSISDFYRSVGLSKQYKRSYPNFVGGYTMGEIKIGGAAMGEIKSRLTFIKPTN